MRTVFRQSHGAGRPHGGSAPAGATQIMSTMVGYPLGGIVIGFALDKLFDTRPWITHRTDFAGLIDRFPSYTKPETGVIKAVVEVG